MIRGLRFAHHKRLIIPGCFLLLIAGLSGCAPSVISSQQIVCTPESAAVNIYRVTPQPFANRILEFSFPSILVATPPTDQQISSSRYTAFQLWVSETERWSDTKIIKLDDFNKLLITLTFISPELFQDLFLSEVIENRFPATSFQDQFQSGLNPIAVCDELLFLLTVAPIKNDTSSIRRTIKIPIGKMILNNAENLEINPSHDDHNLDQLIDATADPVFGYLAYPIALLSGTQCKWILEPKYNTNIVIPLPDVEVDGASNNIPYSWTIPYTALINSITTSNMPIPTVTDPSLITPLPLPPSELDPNNY